VIERRHPTIDGDFEIRDTEKQVGGLATGSSFRRRARQVRALVMGIDPAIASESLLSRMYSACALQPFESFASSVTGGSPTAAR
jgi:hypothetical protein